MLLLQLLCLSETILGEQKNFQNDLQFPYVPCRLILIKYQLLIILYLFMTEPLSRFIALSNDLCDSNPGAWKPLSADNCNG